MLKKYTSAQIKKEVLNLVFMIVGSFILAFGNAIFLTNLNIVAGGLSGIGIILQYHFSSFFPGGQGIDIVVYVLSAVLWVIGLIFLGKEFALKTLFSTLLFPAFLTLFLRVNIFQELARVVSYFGVEDITKVPLGNYIFCGAFGGILIGTGVALTFAGGGSSGGVDVLIAIFAKYTRVKESIWSFIIDGTVILLGMFLIKDNIVPGLIGFLTALVTAMCIELVYGSNQSSYQVDIISDKWEEISRFAQDELGRGATIIHAEGGYKGEERIILRVVFDKRQYNKIRSFISQTDPKAFVTFTQTNAVYGEGFKNHKEEIAVKKVVKKNKKDNGKQS